MSLREEIKQLQEQVARWMNRTEKAEFERDKALVCKLDLLRVVELAYRKHQLDDHTIGSCELGDRLCDAICNEVGASVFSAWVEGIDDGDSLIEFIKKFEEK